MTQIQILSWLLTHLDQNSNEEITSYVMYPANKDQVCCVAGRMLVLWAVSEALLMYQSYPWSSTSGLRRALIR